MANTVAAICFLAKRYHLWFPETPNGTQAPGSQIVYFSFLKFQNFEFSNFKKF
jgi:hypothetical protein